jgi:hypothetical protein
VTHIVFDDYPHNGEGVTFTSPDDRDRDYYPEGAELRVYTGECGDGFLNRADIERLRDALTEHLNR